MLSRTNASLFRLSAAAITACTLFCAKGRIASAEPDSHDMIKLSGTVVDPRGKPVAATVQVISDFRGEAKTVRQRADSTGSFTLQLRLEDIRQRNDGEDWKYGMLVANAEGFGPAGIPLAKLKPSSSDITLELAEDLAISGVIKDATGQPIADATVALISIHECKQGRLDHYLKQYQRGLSEDDLSHYIHWQAMRIPAYRVLGDTKDELKIRTDESGRFTLRGVGAERIAWVYIEGPAIVSDHAQILTRAEIAEKWQPNRDATLGGRLPDVYAANFSYTGIPAEVVRGRVTDGNSGEPIANASINRRATTDTEGRFQLMGVKQSGTTEIRVSPPPQSPYPEMYRVVANANEGRRIDIALSRGVFIRGKVIDDTTEEPVRARIRYRPDRDNNHYRREEWLIYDRGHETDNKGFFTLVALRGPGTLTVELLDSRFVSPQPIRIAPETLDAHQDLEVRASSGFDVVGSIVDDGGQPVSNVEVVGLTEEMSRESLQRDVFTAVGLHKHKDRTIVFRHKARQIGALVTVNYETKQPLQVKLEKYATLTGRILDSTGKSLAKRTLAVVADGTFLHLAEGAAGPKTVMLGLYKTDDDGRFAVVNLIPHAICEILVGENAKSAKLLTSVLLKAGETRDLGDVKLRD